MYECNGNETGCSEHEADDIGEPVGLEARKQGSPEYGTYGLNGEEHTDPVTCRLIALGSHVGRIPYVEGNGPVGVCPHI